MTMPSKVINIRLTPQQAENFQRLKREFAGLPQATVLRLLLTAYFEMPLEKQVDVITRQIRRPDETPKHADTDRLRLNANKGR